MSDVLKDIHVVWMRLFDHKSFVNGEIQFVLREFEQKRDDTEVESLFKIIENITDIKDTQCGKAQQCLEATFPDLTGKLDEALATCRRIESLEQECKADISLQVNRENRKLEWKQFVDNVSLNCEEIDSVCKEKEDEISRHYTALDTGSHFPVV